MFFIIIFSFIITHTLLKLVIPLLSNPEDPNHIPDFLFPPFSFHVT